jgi:hypothetical protein
VPTTPRVWTIDDVQNDEDLRRYFRNQRKLITWLAREYASTAAQLSAMLKAHDDRARKRRRGRVVRPMALAAGVLILISKYLTASAKRFEVEYHDEIKASGRRVRRTDRTIHFGDD